MPDQPAITDEIRTVVDHIALTHFDAWSKRPNRDAYVADLARTVAQASAEAAAPHIASNVLRGAIEAIRPLAERAEADGDVFAAEMASGHRDAMAKLTEIVAALGAAGER